MLERRVSRRSVLAAGASAAVWLAGGGILPQARKPPHPRPHSTETPVGSQSVSISVLRTPSSPPPVITTLTSASSQATFIAKTTDLSIDVIELAAGNYTWQAVPMACNRSARPLTIRPVAGATVNFVGPASTDGSIFGMTGVKYVTFDGSTGAMVFKDFLLAQSGVFQPQGTDHCTFRYLTFSNLGRDGAFSDQPYKSWCFYDSTGINANELIDHCTFLAPAVSRDISALQWASSGSDDSVTVSNCTFVNYDYVVYVERQSTNFTLTDCTLTNCGNSPTPASINFTGAVLVSGTYRNIVATSSDPLRDTHSGGGTMANGGGNSGI